MEFAGVRQSVRNCIISKFIQCETEGEGHDPSGPMVNTPLLVQYSYLTTALTFNKGISQKTTCRPNMGSPVPCRATQVTRVQWYNHDNDYSYSVRYCSLLYGLYRGNPILRDMITLGILVHFLTILHNDSKAWHQTPYIDRFEKKSFTVKLCKKFGTTTPIYSLWNINFQKLHQPKHSNGKLSTHEPKKRQISISWCCTYFFHRGLGLNCF